MEGKEHVLDEIEMILAKRTKGKVNGEEGEVAELKRQVAELEAMVKARDEELAAIAEAEKREGKPFHIIPIVILFEALFGKRAVASEMNVSGFSRLLNKVSGYGISSIDNKIPSKGLDYQSPYIRKQANKVIKYLEEVSPEMAKRIEDKLND